MKSNRPTVSIIAITATVWIFVSLAASQVHGQNPASTPIKDLSGAWSAMMQGPIGSMEITYNLKLTNGRITGTAVTRFGKADIIDGTVDGDSVHFTVEFKFFGNSSRSEARGTVSGDTLLLTPACRRRRLG